MRSFLVSLVAVPLLLPALAGARPSADAAGHTGKPRLVSINGKRLRGPYQRWAKNSLVPIVSGRIHVGVRGCPTRPERTGGCFVPTQLDRIYVQSRMSSDRLRATFFHELGHLYDFRILNSRDRRAFKRLMATSRPWFSRSRAPLGEVFAEAYSFCARYREIHTIKANATFDYDPTPEQHRRACSLIRRAAAHSHRSNPPSNPPQQTRPDPPPPEQPPSEDPEFIPGLPPPPTGGLPPLPLP